MVPMRFPAIALLLILARFTDLIESGTVAGEIPRSNSATDNPELAQWPPKSISDSNNRWHNGERIRWHNDLRNAKLPLALYQRNTWHNITEMGGTMGSELSTLFIGFTKNLAKAVAIDTIKAKPQVSFEYEGKPYSTDENTICIVNSKNFIVLRSKGKSTNRYFEKDKIKFLKTIDVADHK